MGVTSPFVEVIGLSRVGGRPIQRDALNAAELRAQLNGLHDEIASIPQGPPGEVTSAALTDAIGTTARNPISFAPLTQYISDPPTQAEVQAIQGAFNALLTVLQRPPT